MDFRIRTKEFTSAGREIVRESVVSAEEIGVGRASENALNLPDLAVEQHHLRITPTPSGSLRLEAMGKMRFSVDGRSVKAANVDPAKGAELGVGSYRIEIAREEDGLIAFTVQRKEDRSGAEKDALKGFSLSSTLPSKRAMAWAGFAVVLVAFLAVPIWSHLNRVEAEARIEDEGAVMWDASWSTGELSSVHHGLEDNCEACHVEPFQSVQDETCLTCHEDIGDHAESGRLVEGMEQPTGFDAFQWNVAHFFGKPGPGACTDCHTEHEGEGRMEPTAQAFCSDCHDTLDTRLTDTSLGNASDFGELHPQFKATILPTRGATETERVSLDSAPRHWDGLRFPHDVHLSDENGVARMASRLDDYGDVLECADCHTPRADGVNFLPVDMEDDCEACHSLVYDRVGETFRSLSHGDIAAANADLLAADRAPRRPVTTGRMRPGEFGEGGVYYNNFTSVSPSVLRANVLEPDGLCGECHYPAASGGALEVMPVVQQDRFFAHGWFDHEDHTQEDCTSCHAAETSDDATDLLLPDLESCRDCHEGEASLTAEVPSSCAMCHSYHPRSGPASAPPRIAVSAGDELRSRSGR